MAEQNFRCRILSHLIAAAAGSALTFLFVQKEIAREPTDDKPAVQEQAPVVEVPKVPVIPAPVPPLDRGGLIAAAASAADAVASGSAVPQSNAALVGRSFILRMPFGCGGEMADSEQKAEWAGWAFNPKSRALRLVARGSNLADAEWIKQIAGSMEFDAAEGFWLRRPWTRAERCGAKGPALSDAILDPAAQRLAIAQFYSPQSSRTLRRGDRPYSATVKLEEGEGPSPLGYQLQLEGKLSGFPDGQAVHCSQDNPSVAPRCVIAVEFERVAFVAPGKDEPIVEWR
ncbi:hypothetical protein VVT58_00545 [Sphingobium sp. SJ10-10]|uniref:hypothetical protein n=1 Tax=unclassified Sphingobium TaxID=2611147 RepID=UPI000C2059DF|nr:MULTISPECIES: hypothetical protein [unclassified Sphingobium]MEC6698130.1 hypothetical protein [Sphingobium sp. SJ10-10]PJG48894.1 hypothetical protein CAF53_12095 [Sphingobium sp. LB126]